MNYRFNQKSGKLDRPPGYQADIKGLVADSRFQNLDTPAQKAVLGNIAHDSVDYRTQTFSPSSSGWQQ
jgi:hypothetical protein